MRQLLYIPIIHDAADLGSAGALLQRQGAALSGARRWELHQSTVAQFWDRMADCLWPADPANLKVYQDGLPAGGERGKQVVAEAAKRGSRNYQLVLELLDRGAELRQTEDPQLLLQEYAMLRQRLGQSSSSRQESDGDSPLPEGQRGKEYYQEEKDRLTAARDEFIAQVIDSTLRERELGALFIGANHDVASRLASDISLRMVKDPKMVRAYLKELLLGDDNQKLEDLGRYLTLPVDVINVSPQ